MADSGTISLWLGVMAVALVLQTAMLIGGAVFALTLYRRSARAFEDLQRREIEPLLRGVRESLDRVQVVLDRVQRVDHDVRQVLARAGSAATIAVATLRLKTLPAVALGRAATAAWSVLRRRFGGPGAHRSPPAELPFIPSEYTTGGTRHA